MLKGGEGHVDRVVVGKERGQEEEEMQMGLRRKKVEEQEEEEARMDKWKKPLGTMIVRENTAKRMKEKRKDRRVRGSTSNAEMRQRLRQE